MGNHSAPVTAGHGGAGAPKSILPWALRVSRLDAQAPAIDRRRDRFWLRFSCFQDRNRGARPHRVAFVGPLVAWVHSLRDRYLTTEARANAAVMIGIGLVCREGPWHYRARRNSWTFESRKQSPNLSKLLRGDGGTGRRARLRIWFRKKWGFESPFPHDILKPSVGGMATEDRELVSSTGLFGCYRRLLRLDPGCQLGLVRQPGVGLQLQPRRQRRPARRHGLALWPALGRLGGDTLARERHRSRSAARDVVGDLHQGVSTIID